jgi:hypothetical protein
MPKRTAAGVAQQAICKAGPAIGIVKPHFSDALSDFGDVGAGIRKMRAQRSYSGLSDMACGHMAPHSKEPFISGLIATRSAKAQS